LSECALLARAEASTFPGARGAARVARSTMAAAELLASLRAVAMLSRGASVGVDALAGAWAALDAGADAARSAAAAVDSAVHGFARRTLAPAIAAPRARAASRIARAMFVALEAIGSARIGRGDLRERAGRLHAACATVSAIHRIRIDVRGVWPKGPAVLVANHIGYLDAIVIAAALPVAPIAKMEVAAWPIIGGAAREMGVNFVERESVWSRARALRRALEALRAGVPVLNFPEGTTTDGTQLLPFSRGIFGVARLAGVPVVPVAIRCSRDLAWFGSAKFVPSYLRMAAMPAPEIRLELAPPIDPSRFASADEVAAIAHHRLAHLLRDQLEPHATVISFRVPASRPDTVLPAAGRHVAR
jgi:1-acyl-sn-glycerol-3-phosphate acyltransferase